MQRSRLDMKRIKAEVLVTSALVPYLARPLKREPSGHVTCCPIHHGSNKRAFRVSADGRAWYCHGQCQRGGNVLDLISELEKCSIVEAAALLQQRFQLS